MALRRSSIFNPLQYVPVPAQAAALTVVINHILRGQTFKTRLQELDGRSVSVHILDLPWLMHFRIKNRQIRAVTDHLSTDVTISGDLQDFLQLLNGRQDPDTLFFQRRLQVEGDTETGVHLKNLLDAMDYDWDAHFDSFLTPKLAQHANKLRRRVWSYVPVDRLHKFITADSNQ